MFVVSIFLVEALVTNLAVEWKATGVISVVSLQVLHVCVHFSTGRADIFSHDHEAVVIFTRCFCATLPWNGRGCPHKGLQKFKDDDLIRAVLNVRK